MASPIRRVTVVLDLGVGYWDKVSRLAMTREPGTAVVLHLGGVAVHFVAARERSVIRPHPRRIELVHLGTLAGVMVDLFFRACGVKVRDVRQHSCNQNYSQRHSEDYMNVLVRQIIPQWVVLGQHFTIPPFLKAGLPDFPAALVTAALAANGLGFLPAGALPSFIAAKKLGFLAIWWFSG